MTASSKPRLRAKLIAAASLFALGASACSSGSPGAGSAVGTPSSNAALAGGGKSGSGYDATYNFTATTFDGERFELADHKGTPVVINFWESW